MTAYQPKLTRRREPISDTSLLMLVAIGFFVILYIFSILFLGDGFRRPSRIFDILNDNAYLIIISCGLSIVMITGSIDISVGGIVGFVTMVGASFFSGDILPAPDMAPGLRIFFMLLIAIGIGLAFGLVQGSLIAYLDIQPFIVTLAGMFFARGMTTITSGANITLSSKAPEIFKLLDQRIDIPWLGYDQISGIKKTVSHVPAHMEYVIIVALAIVVLTAIMLRKSSLGRHFYAVGGNRQSALMLGVNVRKTRFVAHAISGFLAGVAGFVYLWHNKSGNIGGATAAEMQAIASSIIGGTLLTGGVGNVIGTLFGVLILALIKPIVVDAAKLPGFDWLGKPYWQQIFNGVVLCLFIVLQSIILSVRGKSGSRKSARKQPEQEALQTPVKPRAAQPVQAALSEPAPAEEAAEVPEEAAVPEVTPPAQEPEPAEEVLAEKAHEVIPAAIDGKQIYRFYPDVVIDPVNFDVSGVYLGQPVSFVSIGWNLFAQSRQTLIGRVTRKSVAEKVNAWQLSHKPVAAVITDADASDGDLKVTIALYDDLLKIAEKSGAEPIKLSGVKNEEAQRNIALAKPGDGCSAAFESRKKNGREDRWKVYTADGYVGALAADEYVNDGSRRIVVAEITTGKKDDRVGIKVYVI